MSKTTFHSNVPNLKGKKTYLFRCGCCECRDLRDKFNAKALASELAEEIQEAIMSKT